MNIGSPAFPALWIRTGVVATLFLVAAVLLVRDSAAAPVVTTDKQDYYSGETVTITGTGFAPNTSYDVPVIRPDGSIVLGDGSFTPGWDTVTTDGSGAFTYYYQLNGIYGTYEVRVYNTPWNGDLEETALASTTFTDADIHFSQCRNDNDNDNIKNACSWTTGGLNGNNSLYMEGDGVPQRLFHRLDVAGTYKFALDYDFSRGDIYAYDFLTNVDESQPGALLNECGDLPPFISASQCSDMFGTNSQLGAIVSDPFDGVALRENPPGVGARNIRVGCEPACSAGLAVEFPDPPIGVTDGEAGEAHDPDSDPDCFQDCGTSVVRVTVEVTTNQASTQVGLWFAGHLAEANDPAGSAIGWGTGCSGPSIGCGASTISGAPFHLKYICLQAPGGTCDSVGNRDNQMQIDAVVVPGSITIIKDAIPDDPQDFTFSGSLGSFSLDDDADGTLPNSVTFTDLAPNGYTVTENTVAGWNLTTIQCSDPDGGSTVDIGTATASIDLDEGEDVTCTFSNEASDTDVKITGQTETAPATAGAGTDFTIAVDKTLHNNGPVGPVDVSITPVVSAPADCTVTPDAGNPGSATLSVSTAVDLTENFTVNCTQPSSHVFSIDNCIAITTPDVTDSNTSNNCWPTQQITVDILDGSDIKVTGVTVSSPASANTGASFSVSASADLHNNGGHGPTNVDTSFSLNLPPDCSTGDANPAVVEDTDLPVSTLTATSQVSWTVTCSSPSSHQFSVGASATIDELHVSDPNGVNNSANGDSSTAILSTADLKVSGVTVDAPGGADVGSSFVVTVAGTLHNNGAESPVNTDATIGLSGPGDCTLTPTGGQDQQDLSLSQSTAQDVSATWDVNCTSPSNHQFDGSAAVAVDQQHVSDPDSNNNTAGGSDTTAVTGSADVKVTNVTVGAPASESTDTAFDVTVTATVHNNGTFSPVNTATTISLSGPADCTLAPTGGQDQNASLSTSTAVDLVATWQAECSDPSNHQFDGSASVSITDQHVDDPNTGNNIGGGSDTTAIVAGSADVKVSGVTVDAPASANAGSSFVVTVSATVHNNGTLSPVNTATTFSLAAPADCTLTATGGQNQNAALSVSTPVDLSATWDAVCTSPSNHQFDGSASIAITDQHVSDSNTANDSDSGSDTTAVTGSADVKMTDVVVDAPASANVDSPFSVTVTTTLHNNGPLTTADADVTIALSGPSDCTLTATGGQSQSVPLAQSVSDSIAGTWSATCTDPSNHQFDGSASVALNQLHISDPNSANNAGTSADIAAIVASADSKVVDVNINLPSFTAGDPFVITIDGTVHNNGAYGPVNVDATIELGLPPECSTADANPMTLTGISLPVSVATPVGPAEWTVTCTTTGGLTFDGTLTVADTEIHVNDPDTGNNSKSVAVGGGTSTPTPTPPPGGPNPVGGVAGLLETQENAGAPQNSDAGSGGDLLMIVLATGASLMLAGAAAWASRRSGLL